MKECICCRKLKPIEEYYKHKKMSDGHLNKCKYCVKSTVKKRYKEISKNKEWIEKERKRGRDKYYRLGYKDRNKPTYEQKKRTIKKYFEKYPEKMIARNYTSSMKPKVKGNQLHHWSYKKVNLKDVIELSIRDHNKVHRFLKYDQEHFLYRDSVGNLLGTKEKHLKYIESVIKAA